MESVAAQSFSFPSLLRRVDFGAISIWLLAGGLVIYLAFDGGGYDIVVHSQVATVVWWIVLLGAAAGLLPAARITVWGWVALGLFAGFTAWTALGGTWSLSTERSLQTLSLDAGYLGVLILAIAVHREREHALRHTIGAVASAIVVVAVVALASRLHPGLVTAASQTGTFLPGANARLSWPLNYWNALAALLAFGLPLLLSLTSSARSIAAQAAAAAAIPVIAVSAYLTFSRGGLIAFAVATLAYYVLAPDRLPKLLTGAVAGAASAALIAGCVHRAAIEKGLLTATARHEGSTLIVPILLACAGVALAQVGIGLAVRHGRRPKALMVSTVQARTGLVVGLLVLVVIFFAARGPSRLDTAWQDFKQSSQPGLRSDSLSRFGKLSGNGRYEYWKAAVDSTSGQVLKGHGAGTFQFLWLPRAKFYSYVINAHSLYFETLAETGLVGLALLVGFFLVVLIRALRLVIRTRDGTRTRVAGAAAAFAAFTVSAASDWIWQVPVLPTAALLVGGAVLVASRRTQRLTESAADPRPSGWHWIAVRVAMVVLALACIVAVGVPLATTNAERRSQSAAAAGNLSLALTDAREAARIEPGAASPQVQMALVLEARGQRRAGLNAALKAVTDEPDNWSSWLIVSRLEAETGHPAAAVTAYRRARSLNPQSPIFPRPRLFPAA
jgi:hypothetical protein